MNSHRRRAGFSRSAGINSITWMQQAGYPRACMTDGIPGWQHIGIGNWNSDSHFFASGCQGIYPTVARMKSVEKMAVAIDKLNAETSDPGRWSPPAVPKLHEWIREVDTLIPKEFNRRAANHHQSWAACMDPRPPCRDGRRRHGCVSPGQGCFIPCPENRRHCGADVASCLVRP